MQITNIYGKTEDINCIACDTLKRSNDSANRFFIARSRYFRAEQDFEIPIPGFIIIASDRHFYGIDEMGGDEQQDFIRFTTAVRHAMREALKIDFVHIILDEQTTSSHFHAWLFPHYDWMKEKFGIKLQTIPEIMAYTKSSMTDATELEQVDKAVGKLKKRLAKAYPQIF